MIQDLHAHTYYSFCCNDTPDEVVQAAIRGGVQQLGFCDHNYGIGCARTDFCWNRGTRLDADYEKTLVRYYDHITAIKEKYRNKIKILRGIEVNTVRNEHSYALPNGVDISFFDFALIEGLDDARSITGGDLFAYAKRCGCPVGVAHTDMFRWLAEKGEEPTKYFRKMAEAGIFWELNVNYDSVHSFRLYDYVTEFFKNKRQQEIVRQSGLRVSVGFDNHAIKEYKPVRVQTACKLLKDAGIRLVFENRE